MAGDNGSAFGIRRLGPGFVAEVEGLDLSRGLDEATWKALYAAYLEHQVIVLRGQNLTPRQYLRFGARFGPIEPHTVRAFRHPEAPGITILSNRVEMGRPKGIRDAGSHWHSDYSYKKVTANATLLYALEVPEEGGDTLFADMAAAYEALPEEWKRRLRGLKARHQYRWHPDRRNPESRWRLISKEERRETPEIRHPVVRTHPETGRKGLFVFPGITSGIKGIVGLAPEESAAILTYLYRHATRPRFRYRHRWRAGDVVVWDNRTTMHRATTDVLPADRPRTIYRINTRGSVPV